ncbi:MAG: hypothetical protein Tsb007_26510 [Rhizobacter sp.]
MVTTAFDQYRKAITISRFQVPLVVDTEHADIAGNARCQHRRAAANGLHHHVRPALDSTCVHQNMGTLDAAPRRLMRECTQPSVARAFMCELPSFLAERRIQSFPDVVKQDVTSMHKLSRRREVSLRGFFLPQVADHDAAQVLSGFDQLQSG